MGIEQLSGPGNEYFSESDILDLMHGVPDNKKEVVQILLDVIPRLENENEFQLFFLGIATGIDLVSEDVNAIDSPEWFKEFKEKVEQIILRNQSSRSSVDGLIKSIAGLVQKRN